ncbi:SWI5-dependent HO expression protein 3 [Nakaseomyces bracarensis]|uniref:SWI5-dependent HO expression protein 3 n=1 Tax=Nakaseomyces bracarensis TaxID=273131 RepID=A0ABR4NTN0_9SACH
MSFESPSKLGPQHNLHITNLESPSRYQYEPDDAMNSSNGSVYNNGDDIWSTNIRGTPLSNISSGSNAIADSIGATELERGGSIGATASIGNTATLAGSTNISIKVIEALHGQVDTLSSTNLQLTKQYQDVLNRLKEATDREAELTEELSKLQVGNLELNATLEDRSNEVKERDELYENMKKEYNTLVAENKTLEKDYLENSKTLGALNNRFDKIQAKKNALMCLQENYKQACDDEAEAVRNKLDTLQTKIENFKINEEQYLTKQVKEQQETAQEIEQEASTIEDELRAQESKWNEVLSSVNLDSLSAHYHDSKKQLLELAERLEIPVVLDQDNYVSTETVVVTRPTTTKSRKPTPDAASKRSSFYGVTSPLVTQGFKRQDSHTFTSSPRTPSSSFLPGVKNKEKK